MRDLGFFRSQWCGCAPTTASTRRNASFATRRDSTPSRCRKTSSSEDRAKWTRLAAAAAAAREAASTTTPRPRTRRRRTAETRSSSSPTWRDCDAPRRRTTRIRRQRDTPCLTCSAIGVWRFTASAWRFSGPSRPPLFV